jgi:hypothetical protein
MTTNEGYTALHFGIKFHNHKSIYFFVLIYNIIIASLYGHKNVAEVLLNKNLYLINLITNKKETVAHMGQ